MQNERKFPSRKELLYKESEVSYAQPKYYVFKAFLLVVLMSVTILIPAIGCLEVPVSYQTSNDVHQTMLSVIQANSIGTDTNLSKVDSAASRYKVRISASQTCVGEITAARGERLVDKTYQLQWPVYENTFTITSGFGPRQDPIDGRTLVHTGTDMAGPLGTPILAIADGVVTKVDVFGGAGRVIISHDIDGKKFESWYIHMYQDDIHVKEGEKVYMGQEIATIGSSGHSTGPHLHFEIRPEGKDPVDAHIWLEENKAVLVSRDC